MSVVQAVLLDPQAVIYLFNLAVAATLVSGLGLAICRMYRHQSAPVRHGILLGTLAIVLLLPFALWLNGYTGLVWMQVAIAERPDSATEPEQARPVSPGTEVPPADEPTLSSNMDPHFGPESVLAPPAEYIDPSFSPSEFAGHTTLGAAGQTRCATTPVPEHFPTLCWWQLLGTVLAVVWLAGSLVQLVRLIWGYRVLGRFRRSLEEVAEPRTRALVERARVEVGRRVAPQVFHSPHAPAPMCLGLITPIIVMPGPIAQELDDDQLHAILIHEMAHLVRQDIWVGLALRAAVIAFWWNVLVYRVQDQIAELREDICDNYVCRAQRERSRFAETLIELASRATTQPVESAALGFIERTALVGRIARLLDKERNMATRMSAVSRGFVLAWTGVVLLAVVLTGGLRVAQSAAFASDTAANDEERPAVAAEPSASADEASKSSVKPVKTLSGHSAAVRAVAFSPGGRMLASAGLDGDVKLWQMPEGIEIATLKPDKEAAKEIAVNALAFAPDGKVLASAGSDGIVRFWDPVAAKQVRSLEGHKGQVFCLAFSSDGKKLASGGADRTIRLWDVISGEAIPGGMVRPGGAVRGVAFGKDGDAIVSIDGPLRVFAIDPPQERARLNNWTEVRSLACSPDDQAMAIGLGYGQAISLWIRTGDKQLERYVLGGHYRGTNALAFSPDSKTLASVGGDGQIRVWDLSTRRLLGAAGVDSSAALAVAFSPDGRQVASAGDNQKVLVWDVDQVTAGPQEEPRFPNVKEPARPVMLRHAEEPRLVGEMKRLGAVFVAKGARPSWSPDATRIVYVTVPVSELEILDLNTGQIQSLDATGRDPAWSPKPGRWIVYTTGRQNASFMGSRSSGGHFTDPASGDEEIRLIDSSGGESRKIADGYAPAWSDDGKTLYFVSGKDQKVKSVEVEADGSPGAMHDLFEVSTRSLVAAISPHGPRVAYLGDGRLVVADAEGDRTMPTWPVRHLRDWLLGWSPDGKVLGGTNVWGFGGLLFLDQVSGRAVRVGTGELVAPAWSPDGSMIAFNAHLVDGSEIWMLDAKVLDPLRAPETPYQPKGEAAHFDVETPFQPKGQLVCVDVQPKADHPMDLPIFDTPVNDMAQVPRGEQTFGGVKFTIGPGSLQLGSGLLTMAPERIEGIPVGKRVARMYVLHGAQFSGPKNSVADGTTIGWYRVVYEDQTEESIAVVAGEDVRNWFSGDSQPPTRGYKAWTGENRLAGWLNLKVRLFASGWTNPHPEKKVARIDYLTAGTQAAPFCLAITVEEPVGE